MPFMVIGIPTMAPAVASVKRRAFMTVCILTGRSPLGGCGRRAGSLIVVRSARTRMDATSHPSVAADSVDAHAKASV